MNNFQYRIISFFLIMTISFGLFAQNAKPLKDTVLFKNKLAEMTLKIKTIESDFVQEKRIDVLSEDITSDGHFCFKKENRIRWEYTTPTKYLIIINDTKITVKDNKKESNFDAKSNKVFAEVNDMLSKSMRGDIMGIGNKYRLQYFEEEKFYLVKMTPTAKAMKEFLKEIHLYFDKTDYTVMKVKMLEPSGDYTFISFKNKKLNEPVADEKFSIK